MGSIVRGHWNPLLVSPRRRLRVKREGREEMVEGCLQEEVAVKELAASQRK